MKKIKNVFATITFTFLLIVLIYPTESYAQSVDYTGGIKNEYDYAEYIFITGTPIKFTGKSKSVSITVKESKGKLIETYKLTLMGPSGQTLTRNFTYTSDVTNYDQIGQSSATGEVTKFTEKITIGSTVYTLADYQLSKSAITDKRPASDYYAGNAIARKTYTMAADKKNPNPPTITVNVDNRNEGYENFWGATEAQTTEYEIIFANGEIGTVKNNTVMTKSRTLEYTENGAGLSSFNGNYKTVSSAETSSEYIYELPQSSGTVSLDMEYMPKIEMLKIPKFRDLSSNWAKENIEKLYSLGILEDQSNFFSPNTPMQRFDFAVAIGKAIDLRVLEETTKKSKKKTPTTSIFNDVKRTIKDYNYLAAAVEKGVIKGTTPKTFEPDGFLTRQQAATILVRALGLEEKAPDPGYSTQYKDDYKITDYARDSIYVVTELGLMSGSDGYFNPKGTLTRAQASAIIDRFLQYLETDLKENYKEIISY